LHDLEAILPEPHLAVGIDGSMDYDEVLEMLLFYVAASGYRCRFSIDGKQIKFDLLDAKRIENLFASAVVPLWEEDLLNVVRTTEQIETEVDFRSTMERIPFALMTMSELYLAWKAVSNDEIRILFLDRPFSGTYPSLYRDFSYMMRRRTVAFEGLETKEGKVEKLEIMRVRRRMSSRQSLQAVFGTLPCEQAYGILVFCWVIVCELGIGILLLARNAEPVITVCSRTRWHGRYPILSCLSHDISRL
jgi:hypothetical protein